jgi:hypothetical protein
MPDCRDEPNQSPAGTYLASRHRDRRDEPAHCPTGHTLPPMPSRIAGTFALSRGPPHHGTDRPCHAERGLNRPGLSYLSPTFLPFQSAAASGRHVSRPAQPRAANPPNHPHPCGPSLSQAAMPRQHGTQPYLSIPSSSPGHSRCSAAASRYDRPRHALRIQTAPTRRPILGLTYPVSPGQPGLHLPTRLHQTSRRLRCRGRTRPAITPRPSHPVSAASGRHVPWPTQPGNAKSAEPPSPSTGRR